MIKTIPLLPQRKNAETMKLQIIDTGYFYADGGAMFGAIPKSAWSRRYPSDETNGCVLAMRSLVIKTDDGRIVLVDNGAGNKHLKQLKLLPLLQLGRPRHGITKPRNSTGGNHGCCPHPSPFRSLRLYHAKG